MIRIIALAAGLFVSVAALSACNTVKGLGEDVESVGEAGDRAL